MKKPQTMKELATIVGDRLVPIRAGEICEVKILQVLRNKIVVDVGGLTLGYIPEQEFSPEIGELKTGDKIFAYVLTVENDDGYVVLSLRRADREKVTKILQEKLNSGESLQVRVLDANKGGLLCQFGDYEGFLPVSQLASSHYPKVESGNREEILNRLKQFMGKIFQVKILSFDPNSRKLIFSEKAAGDLAQEAKIKEIKIGDILAAEITGIVDFGLFVKAKLKEDQEAEGLVHISEASWEHVDDLKKIFKIGQKIKVEVISKDDNRLSFSVKRLQADPWKKLAKIKKVGQIVEGMVTKITPYGAFVKVDGIDGLVHISEMGEKISDPTKVIEENKTYQFKIVSFEPELHKLSLSLKDIKIPKTVKKTKAIPKKSKIKKV